MIISYSKMFVVQHMEKTGGTTVTHSLAPHLEMYDMVINDWTKLIFNREGDVLSEHAPSMIIAKYLENCIISFHLLLCMSLHMPG